LRIKKGELPRSIPKAAVHGSKAIPDVIPTLEFVISA
jgi:hypothetical protein